VRTLVGVVVVGLILAGLAAAAVRGMRRFAWSGSVEDAGRTTVQTVVEGLIVLAAIIVGVVIVVALFD
jgi:L-lactate permease